jgi:hypothetical protein
MCRLEFERSRKTERSTGPLIRMRTSPNSTSTTQASFTTGAADAVHPLDLPNDQIGIILNEDGLKDLEVGMTAALKDGSGLL